MKTARIVYRVSRNKSRNPEAFLEELGRLLRARCKLIMQDLFIDTLLSPTLRYLVLGEDDTSETADIECSAFYLDKFKDAVETGDPEYDLTVGMHAWTHKGTTYLELEAGKPMKGCVAILEEHPSLIKMELPNDISRRLIPRPTYWVVTPETYHLVDPAIPRTF